MAISQIITSFPPAPNAGSDTPEEFSNKADAFVAHQSDNYTPEVNQWADEANSTATDVNTDAGNASTSAGEASASATLANQWAENPEDIPVVADEYSALHWAKKAEAVDALQPDVTSLQIQGDYVSAFNMRNKLINGGFDVWQRGTSFNANGFISDRWQISGNGTFTISRYSNYLPTKVSKWHTVINVTAVTSYCNLSQRIEDVRTLQGKTVTLSFGVSNAGEIAIQTIQNFGDGGTAQEIVPREAISTGGHRRVSITFDIADLSGKTLGDNSYLEIIFGLIDVTSYEIYDVQLEEGSVATPFEVRPIGMELSLCKRYYEVGRSGLSGTDGQYIGTSQTIIEKRVTPTVTFTIVTGANATNVDAGSLTPLDIWFAGNCGSELWIEVEWSANAEL